ALLQQMTRIAHKEVSVDTLVNWSDLYEIIDSLYDNFYTILISSYGALLSEKEIQICCMLCAGFSTKEISTVTQQSLRTVYQRKSYIRGKLQMEEKEDIVNFVRNHAAVI
ncbi:MAG: LuxR C-terminal-related transcriptional regulator, partial [Parabacteroides sp.]